MNQFICRKVARRISSALVIGFSIFYLGTHIARAESDTTPEMTLNLSIFSQETWKADSTKPLHLFLSIYNDSARQQGEINRNNQKTLAAYKDDGSIDSLNEKTRENLAAKSIRSIKIGKKDLPLNQWFKWQIIDSNGKKSPLKADILAIDKNLKNVVNFDENQCLLINFGVKEEELKDLAPGKYSIYVKLSDLLLKSCSNTKSNDVTLNLVASDAPSASKSYLYGLFYCLDEKFDKAETYAANLLKDDPNSLEGTGLMARVNAGKKQWKDSLPLLRKYIKLHREKFALESNYHPPRLFLLLLSIAQKKLSG